MTKGIPRKQQLAEQRHARRIQSAATWGSAAKKPVAAVPIASTAARPPAGSATAVSELLPQMRYPTRRSSLGKPQEAKR